VATLEQTIAALAENMLDKVAPLGRMDVMKDLAEPLPVTVIASLLGVPQGDHARLKAWSDHLVGSSEQVAQGDVEARRQAQQELNDYVRDVIAEKRRRPGDDLVSGLLAAEIDGASLSEPELLGFTVLLLIAGHETTTNLIGNGFLTLLEHPEALDRLRRDPGMVASAVEEILRYRSPIQGMVRLVARDTTLAGSTLPAGERAVAWIGSGNRDAAVFPEPERFDIARRPNRHLAFGHGIHFCLGAPLARLEGRIVLDAMLRRLREPGLEPGQAPEFSPGFVHGPRHLRIRFRPETRR
jgi:cytochrome P450